MKKHPEHGEAVRATLERMEADVFHPHLRTHKLKGSLSERWAASAGYDLRIIFSFGARDGMETIQLLSLGSHDEVY